MDPAVALWIAVPLAAAHLLARRSRAVLGFLLLLDLMLLLLPGRLLLSGLHLGPGYAGAETWGAPVTVAGSAEQSDLPLQFAVWWEEVRRLVAAGEPPWISDRIGGGSPLYANGQSGLPFPLNLPVWILGAERGTDVMAVWKLGLASLGAFVLFRRLRLRPVAGAAGALAYGFGLYSVSWLVVPLAWVVAAAPWSWWALIGCLRGRRAETATLAVLLGALAGWSVHPETAAFLWMSVIGAGVILAWGRRRRLLRLAAPVGLALAISGIGALPTLAAVADSAKLASSRGEPRYPMAGVDGPMRLRAVALLLTPWREGHPGEGSWRLPFPSAALAAGAGAAAITLLGAGGVRRRLARHRLAVVTVGLSAAALLWQVPPVAGLLARVPVLGVMTWSRAGFLLSFALAVLAACALDGALRRRHDRRVIAAAVSVQAVVIALLATGQPARSRLRSVALAGSPIAMGGACLLGGAGGGAVAAGVVALEALGSAWDLLPGSRHPAAEGPIAADLRRRLVHEGGRVVGLGEAFPANLPARWGATDLRSHDPMRPAELARLHRALGASGGDLPGPLTAPWSGLSGAWGVRWLVTPVAGLEGPLAEGWEEEYRGGDGRIYRNARALPTVRFCVRATRLPADVTAGAWERIDLASVVLTDDDVRLTGGGALALQEQRPWRVKATTEGEGVGMLVVHTPRAPGWAAFLDGRSTGIRSADLGAMGVLVPPGRHEIVLRYEPPWLRLGAALTLLGLGGAGWLGVRRPG